MIASDIFMYFERGNEYSVSASFHFIEHPGTTSLLNANLRMKSYFRWGVWRFPDSKHDTPVSHIISSRE